MGALDRKNLLILWLITLLFIAGEILLQFTPYIHFYPKSEYVIGEYKLSSFKTEHEVRHSVKYSIFTDDNGNTVKVRSSLSDYKGRKVKLYVRNKDDAYREKFELKYISMLEIVIAMVFIIMTGVTISWLKAKKQQ